MQKTRLLIIVSLLTGLIFTAFQCTSTELTSARLYIQQENFDKALDVLKKEVSKNPKSDEGWYLMGYVYGEKGVLDSMVMAYEKSLAISKKFETEITNNKLSKWAESFNRGFSYYKRGSETQDPDSMKMYFDKAIESYKLATLIEPDSALTYRNLAFVYLMDGRNEDAIEPLQKLIEINKELDGYKYLGQIYYTDGVNARQKYQMEGNPEDSIKAQEYFNKAIEVLEEGTKLYPDDGELLKTLSACYVETGREDVALNSFKELVEKNPDDKVFRYNYGVILLQVGNYAEAEKQFKKALEIDPDYANAAYNLGVTYVQWGTEMSKEIERSGKMDDSYKEKYRLSIPYLEEVVKLEPDNVDVWELLGKVYSVLDMEEKAMDAFSKVDQLRGTGE